MSVSVRAWASVPGSASVHAWVSVSASRRAASVLAAWTSGSGRGQASIRRGAASAGVVHPLRSGRRRRVRRRAGRCFDGSFRAVRGRPEWRRSCTGRRAARWGPDLCFDAPRRPEPTGQRLRQDHGDHDERTCRDRPSQFEPPQERGEQTPWGDGRDGRHDIGIGACRTGARRVVPAPSTRIFPAREAVAQPDPAADSGRVAPPLAARAERARRLARVGRGCLSHHDLGSCRTPTPSVIQRTMTRGERDRLPRQIACDRRARTGDLVRGRTRAYRTARRRSGRGSIPTVP